MTLETIKLIAALCQITGGDTNTFNSVIGQIQTAQTECQAFYSRCTENRTLQKCMKERQLLFENQRADWDEKFKDHGNQIYGPHV